MEFPLATRATPVVPRPRPAPRPRVTPERDAQFDHLPLEGLRAYRRALTAEESKVSYWRRILQTRLDVVRSEDVGGRLDIAHLAHLLTDERVGVGRQALVEVLPTDDIPPLPNLTGLWRRSPVPGDEAGNAQLAQELVAAERQLSLYRAALHRRLAAATGELIARYREEPNLCLSALPLAPAGERRRVGA
ncbi:MAG: hypothetical protein M3Z02_07450 [Actinomycetota bacterium]|nr:hypothetical protein [Actinomycetota bacterium]